MTGRKRLDLWILVVLLRVQNVEPVLVCMCSELLVKVCIGGLMGCVQVVS